MAPFSASSTWNPCPSRVFRARRRTCVSSSTNSTAPHPMARGATGTGATGGAGCSRARGNRMMNVAPRPGCDSMAIEPLACSMMDRLVGSPSPVPRPTGLVVKNGSNDARLHVVTHSSAGIGRAELDLRRLRRNGDRQLPAVRHGIARVGGQVSQHLLQLPRIGEDAGRFLRRQDHHLDPLADQTLQQSVGLFRQEIQIDDPWLDELPSRERQELPREPGGALTGPGNLLQVVQQRGCPRRAFARPARRTRRLP